jgi:parallel beta-helix repeat protein
MVNFCFPRNKKEIFLKSSALVFFVWAVFGFLEIAFAATYYVDATSGDDSNTGTSTETPWQTISKVNSSSFSPGDSILFKRGEIWREKLVTPSSGTEGGVISFGDYGDGNMPKITSSQIVSGAPDLYDVYSEYSSNDNADFEEWTGSIPTGWSTAIAGSSTSSQESSIKQEGNYSVKLIKDGSNAMTLYRTMTHKTGMRYRVKFYARGGSGGEEVGVRLRHFSGGVTDCQSSVDSDGFHDTWSTVQNQTETFALTTNWQEFVLDFQTETPTNQIRFEVNTNGAVVYIDNLRAYPMWTPHTSLSDVYGLHYDNGSGSKVEIFKDSTDRLNSILQEYPENLSDQEFTYTDSGTGTWVYWYKDASGNPDTSGVNLEMTLEPEVIDTNGKDYLNFSNLEVYGARSDYPNHSSAILIDSSDNVTVEDSKVYLAEKHNISSRNSTNVTISNNETYFGGSWCIDASLNSDEVTISDNVAHDCGNAKQDDDDGHGIAVNTASNVVIENNNVYANGYGGGDDDGNMRQAVVVWAATDCVIRNNNIYDNYRGGIGVQTSLGSNGSGNEVYGNLVYDNGIGDSSSGDVVHAGISVSANSGDLSEIEVYDNTVYGNDFSGASSDYAGSIQLKSGSSSQVSVVVKNNLIVNNVGDYDLHWITWSGGSISSTLNYNNYFRSNSQDIVYWGGIKSWNTYHISEGNETNSLNQDPLFTSSSPSQASHFQLQYLSPVIDAGTDVGLTTDYAGNPVYGTPDIGAYEYQPPYTMGTHEIDISGNVRIYGDGRFRNTQIVSGETIDLSITPSSGSFPTYTSTQARPEWLNISPQDGESSITWTSSLMKWKESSDYIGNNITKHTIGGLKKRKYYIVSVDNIQGSNITGDNCNNGICKTNTHGELTFNYTGGYSSHNFTIEKRSEKNEVYDVEYKATKDSIIIQWDTTNNSDEKIRYGKNEEMNHEKENSDRSKKHKITIKNLNPNTTYYFRIKSEDRYGNIDRSRTYKVKTKEQKQDQESIFQTITTPQIIKTIQEKEAKESEEKVTKKDQEVPQEEAITRSREEQKKDEEIQEEKPAETQQDQESLNWLEKLINFLFGWVR